MHHLMDLSEQTFIYVATYEWAQQARVPERFYCDKQSKLVGPIHKLGENEVL